jgi:putative FmdB family regulatory protein
MPIYEYECGKCGVFEKLVFGGDEVVCPNCGGSVERLMSACNFKSAGRGGDMESAATSTGGSSCSGCTATSCAGCH